MGMRHFLSLLCIFFMTCDASSAVAGGASQQHEDFLPGPLHPSTYAAHTPEPSVDQRPAEWRWVNDLRKTVYFRGVNLRAYVDDMELIFSLNRVQKDILPGEEISLDTSLIDWLVRNHHCDYFQLIFLYWPPGRPEVQSTLVPPAIETPCIFLTSHLARRKDHAHPHAHPF